MTSTPHPAQPSAFRTTFRPHVPQDAAEAAQTAALLAQLTVLANAPRLSDDDRAARRQGLFHPDERVVVAALQVRGGARDLSTSEERRIWEVYEMAQDQAARDGEVWTPVLDALDWDPTPRMGTRFASSDVMTPSGATAFSEWMAASNRTPEDIADALRAVRSGLVVGQLALAAPHLSPELVQTLVAAHGWSVGAILLRNEQLPEATRDWLYGAMLDDLVRAAEPEGDRNSPALRAFLAAVRLLVDVPTADIGTQKPLGLTLVPRLLTLLRHPGTQYPERQRVAHLALLQPSLTADEVLEATEALASPASSEVMLVLTHPNGDRRAWSTVLELRRGDGVEGFEQAPDLPPERCSTALADFLILWTKNSELAAELIRKQRPSLDACRTVARTLSYSSLALRGALAGRMDTAQDPEIRGLLLKSSAQAVRWGLARSAGTNAEYLRRMGPFAIKTPGAVVEALGSPLPPGVTPSTDLLELLTPAFQSSDPRVRQRALLVSARFTEAPVLAQTQARPRARAART